MLVLTKADFDDVISHYPEQSDVLMTNMLLQYCLTRDGEEIRTKGFDQRADEEGYAQLRAAIQVCYLHCGCMHMPVSEGCSSTPKNTTTIARVGSEVQHSLSCSSVALVIYFGKEYSCLGRTASVDCVTCGRRVASIAAQEQIYSSMQEPAFDIRDQFIYTYYWGIQFQVIHVAGLDASLGS